MIGVQVLREAPQAAVSLLSYATMTPQCVARHRRCTVEKYDVLMHERWEFERAEIHGIFWGISIVDVIYR